MRGDRRSSVVNGATPAMWDAYQADPTLAHRNAIVEAEHHLVRVAVRSARRRMQDRFSDKQLASWAGDGLMDAVEAFKPELGFQFEPFAVSVMWTAIVNGVRLEGWEPHRDQRLIGNDGERVYTVALADPEDLVGQSGAAESLHDAGLRAGEGEALSQQVHRVLLRWIRRLPQREHDILVLYYLDGLTVEEIAERIGRSKATVSSIRQAALARFDPMWTPPQVLQEGLGARLVVLRRQRGWSQARLAGQLGVSQPAVAAWELGNGTPTLGRIVALADLYDVDLRSMLVLAAVRP